MALSGSSPCRTRAKQPHMQYVYRTVHTNALPHAGTCTCLATPRDMHTCALTHGHTHSCPHTCIHAHVLSHLWMCIHGGSYLWTHADVLTPWTHTYVLLPTLMCTHTHEYTCSFPQTHKHLCSPTWHIHYIHEYMHVLTTINMYVSIHTQWTHTYSYLHVIPPQSQMLILPGWSDTATAGRGLWLVIRMAWGSREMGGEWTGGE